MRRIFLLAGLLPAGCSDWLFSPSAAAGDNSPSDSRRGRCERAAEDDPLVREARATSAVTANYNQVGALARLEAAKRQAVARCLLQNSGAGPGGGVELPRR